LKSALLVCGMAADVFGDCREPPLATSILPRAMPQSPTARANVAALANRRGSGTCMGSSRGYVAPKIEGMTQTAFDMTRPLRSRWDQEGAEFVQSNSDWCARACARLLTLNSQLQAADALQLVQEWSLKDGLRALSPELVAEDAARTL